jgi:hypothetical protein
MVVISEIPHISCNVHTLNKKKWIVSKLRWSLAWVQSQARSCRIFGGQSGTGAGFLQVLLFAAISLSINCTIFINLPISDAI